MSATIIDVKEAAYNENGTISAKVLFGDADSKSPKYLPFTASDTDSTAYGRQLFTDLKAGKYGPVTPFTVTPEMLTAAKEAKRAEINAWRNVQENANYVFQFNDHNWDYGKSTQDRLSLSVQMAKQNKLPVGFIWTDADNNDVPMTAGELLKLSDAIDQAMFTMGLQIHMRQRQMKEEVDKLTDYKSVHNYAVGWHDDKEE
ncbi:DUF4376 domain-containing protein [Salmonella enterica subsp. enterica serovar Chester]|uniref:DUF4376 domain-containing protein n=1 Tax=Salmonella enterica TaxID=28901 RepID=A0A760ZQD0_SALER|nr:DUF4376 domain-containing protein [Salmonella enterica subsp. enterica serovar Chester]EBM0030907.1 DUF4376 domain-containing protein [Salmonella enterica]EBY7078040.1 DUF4376 domain-containing protein [Salmonella enterica subsp. enterica serovar Ealing]EDG3842275.1 DUF4376 domain-containing protein [Salmonella enterica subsp. enterica serovar Rissen]EDQ9821141.1 DUF4376 domain-containing protein [Salmonella enterica subsp. enterica]EDT5579924.1 DUF4376 domain-containing protein [Salmonella